MHTDIDQELPSSERDDDYDIDKYYFLLIIFFKNPKIYFVLRAFYFDIKY